MPGPCKPCACDGATYQLCVETSACGGRLVGGATVRFRGPSGSGIDTTITADPNQTRVCYDDPPAGAWLLTVSHPCFVTRTVAVTLSLPANRVTRVELAMECTEFVYSDDKGSGTMFRTFLQGCVFQVYYEFTSSNSFGDCSTQSWCLGPQSNTVKSGVQLQIIPMSNGELYFRLDRGVGYTIGTQIDCKTFVDMEDYWLGPAPIVPGTFIVTCNSMWGAAGSLLTKDEWTGTCGGTRSGTFTYPPYNGPFPADLSDLSPINYDLDLTCTGTANALRFSSSEVEDLPLSDAEVSVSRQPSGYHYEGMTECNGFISLSGILPDGNYNGTLTLPGEDPWEFEFTYPDDFPDAAPGTLEIEAPFAPAIIDPDSLPETLYLVCTRGECELTLEDDDIYRGSLDLTYDDPLPCSGLTVIEVFFEVWLVSSDEMQLRIIVDTCKQVAGSVTFFYPGNATCSAVGNMRALFCGGGSQVVFAELLDEPTLTGGACATIGATTTRDVSPIVDLMLSLVPVVVTP